MKLLLAFLQPEDAPRVVRQLREENMPVTSLESEGGFLRRRNTTILAALSDEHIARAVEIIRELCHGRMEQVDTSFSAGVIEGVGLPRPTEIPVGGATVLILPIGEMIKID